MSGMGVGDRKPWNFQLAGTSKKKKEKKETREAETPPNKQLEQIQFKICFDNDLIMREV